MPKSAKYYPIQLLIVLTVSLMLSTVAASATDVPISDFQTTNLEGATVPVWNMTGTWSPDGQVLHLVDPFQGEILSYGADGHFLGAMSASPEMEDYRPVALRTIPNGYIIEYYPGKFAELDQELEWVRPLSVLKRAVDGQPQLLTLVQWITLEKDIVAFADLKHSEDEYSSAIVRIPLDPSIPFEVVAPVSVSDPNRMMYHLGLPYLAGLESTQEAYFFVPGQHRGLYRVRPGTPGSLEGLSTKAPASDRLKSYSGLPRLPEKQGPQNAEGLFESLVRSQFVSGLYGWEKWLFLALREPRPEGGTSWKLLARDPVTGDETVFELVGIHDPHLTIIPGPDWWAIVRKGPVEGIAEQEVRALSIVNAKKFEVRPLRVNLP